MVPNPGPRDPAQQKPVNNHSFESGLLEQGNTLNMQDRGSRGPGLGTTPLESRVRIMGGLGGVDTFIYRSYQIGRAHV